MDKLSKAQELIDAYDDGLPDPPPPPGEAVDDLKAAISDAVKKAPNTVAGLKQAILGALQ